MVFSSTVLGVQWFLLIQEGLHRIEITPLCLKKRRKRRVGYGKWARCVYIYIYFFGIYIYISKMLYNSRLNYVSKSMLAMSLGWKTPWTYSSGFDMNIHLKHRWTLTPRCCTWPLSKSVAEFNRKSQKKSQTVQQNKHKTTVDGLNDKIVPTNLSETKRWDLVYGPLKKHPGQISSHNSNKGLTSRKKKTYDQNMILLMEVILHQLGCVKLYYCWWMKSG